MTSAWGGPERRNSERWEMGPCARAQAHPKDCGILAWAVGLR